MRAETPAEQSPVHLSDRQAQESVHWHPAAEPPPLAPGDLHLWRIRTAGGGPGPRSDPLANLEACVELLGEQQRARAGRMTHAAYRERYVRSQAGLRRILGLYLNRPPHTLVFRHGPAGKPGLGAARTHPSGLALEFNLTTTEDLALVGISLGSELGVDCEWIRPRRDLDGIARRMFDPVRAASIAALPHEDRLPAFYRAWTALEADAKSDGRGLFRPRAPGARPPQVQHCVPAQGYIAAVAREQLPPIETWCTLVLSTRCGYRVAS